MVKKLSLIAGIFFVSTAAIAYYFWRQVTGVPDWYQEDVAISADQSLLQQTIQTKVNQQRHLGNPDPNRLDVTLNSQELGQILQQEIRQTMENKLPPTAIASLKTQVTTDQIEVGTLVNPQELETLNLSKSQRAVVQKLVQEFPPFQAQTIYIGIVGKPELKQNTLILPVDSQIKVGQLSFTVAEIAQKLNLSPEELQQSLQMPIDQLNLRGLQLKENAATLTVDPNDYAPD